MFMPTLTSYGETILPFFSCAMLSPDLIERKGVLRSMLRSLRVLLLTILITLSLPTFRCDAEPTAARVYYYSAANPNGEDVLVYHDSDAPVPMRSGVITLPRLVLNYYTCIAAALALGCGVLTVALKIARKHRRAWAMLYITMVPLCYAAASAVILHGKSDIYNVEHYLSAILLITVILNLLFKIIVLLFRKGE